MDINMSDSLMIFIHTEGSIFLIFNKNIFFTFSHLPGTSFFFFFNYSNFSNET